MVEKHRNFVQAYLQCFDAAEAARRAQCGADALARPAVRLVLEDDPPIGELDLTLLSEVKRSEKGAIEVRLADRIRALEELQQSLLYGFTAHIPAVAVLLLGDLVYLIYEHDSSLCLLHIIVGGGEKL